MNYMQIDKTSISNGLGFRIVLWISGCTLQCKGCHNPQAQDFNAGQPFDEKAKEFLFEQLSKPYIKGITFSGGHPLEEESINEIYVLCKEIKDKYPTKDIWLYTGYKYDFIANQKILDTIALCDVIVDGPYIEEQRDVTLAFRGSRNQRLIDVKETIKTEKIITLQID